LIGMSVVVADTSPINYLVQIDAIELLPILFGKVAISAAVQGELTHRSTPAVVRAWMAAGAQWLEIRPNPDLWSHGAMPGSLDAGERTTIELADTIEADLILMDDRDGVAFARAQEFAVTGTLGVLDLAAQRGLIDLIEAFTRLSATTFYYRQGLLDALLAQHAERKK
jgi:predicted nucleic acid-binding protein